MGKNNIREEEIKNQLATDFFPQFDCTGIIGNIDFSVKYRRDKNLSGFENLTGLEDEYLLWAEAKRTATDIVEMLTQLVLTIGKARTFDKIMPPKFLGAFDSEKIAFVPYHEIQDIFYQNDFNWNIAPSNYDTKEFKQVYGRIKNITENNVPFETYLFYFEKDEKELRRFIKDNFTNRHCERDPQSPVKLKIDRNNFIIIYNKWLETVKPTIAGVIWENAKKVNIIDGDFYLADLLSQDNISLKEKLYVLLKSNFYEIDRTIDDAGFFASKRADFTDNQKAHKLFWAKYERPPLEDYWDFIIDHRHLLVPQDIRERKGSFYTPKIWVEKSQEYLAKVLGEAWQDEYYVWDCAAGTGNLLAGLTNKYKIFASTLDKQDVAVMHDRIENGANLLDEHVFQFDFLNDDFLPKSKGGKLPDVLFDIISDEKRRKNLVIYINPPYAEASKMRTLQSGNEGSKGVEQSAVNKKYANLLGQGNAELFAQFFTRIYHEIQGAILAEFSTLKILQGQHFVNFRKFFLAKLEKMFICPSYTFDNVNGNFPIGFMIWNTGKKEMFKKIKADVFDKNGQFANTKNFYAFTDSQYINDWIKPFRAKKVDRSVIGKFPFKGNDFQNQGMITIVNIERAYNIEAGQFLINPQNLIPACVYFTVRKCIEHTWINNQDQFLYPNKKWEEDTEFHNDCLAYAIFTNKISSQYGVNHWIPFAETEITAKTEYKSHILISFLIGEVIKNAYTDLFEHLDNKKHSKFNWKKGVKRDFSPEAQAVFDAGREIWKYYHSRYSFFKKNGISEYNINASLYDIKEFFKGRDDKGKMNNRSQDEEFNRLEQNLREKLQLLAAKIEPKVYEYGFLME